MSAGEAFVTLAATDSYCAGAAVVAGSLRRHGTTRRIVAMVTPNVSQQARLGLESVFDEVIAVDVMDSQDSRRLALLGRPELGITFTKIHCWTLTQYSKCVFLDADTLVLCNVDDLFKREELSAAPDPGWPDCFNSGVFVFRPSLHTHTMLLNHAQRHGSFDGGDQGLLNSFFSSWPEADISKHLPFVYNLSASSVYSYLPAFQQFGKNAKIVHFLGATKPWSSRRQREASHSHTMEPFVTLWWKEYHSRTTPIEPGKRDPRDTETQQEKTQQVQEQEDKIPFRENLDSADSQLADLSSPAEKVHHSPLEPRRSQTDATEEDWTSSESADGAEVQDSSSSGESLEEGDSGAQPRAGEQLQHRRLWEAGQVDYLGRDSFQNIQRMLDFFLD